MGNAAPGLIPVDGNTLDDLVDNVTPYNNSGGSGAGGTSTRSTESASTGGGAVVVPVGNKEDNDYEHGDNDMGFQDNGMNTNDDRKFTGLLAAAINNIKQKEMDKLVAKGYLWWKSTRDFVPTAAVGQVDDTCWQHFVGCKIFTWRLEKMMPPGWKPKCVSCCQSTAVRMHCRDRDPRLVYGIKSNYLLNSPEQWFCEACKQINASEKANNITAEKRTQYTFSSHHTDVLEELAKQHPGIRSLFPCELGWRSAIDNDLVDLLTSAANSGMGPSSIHQFVKTCHFHHHDSCELRWLQFLTSRRRNPTLIDGDNLNATIEKLRAFPSYVSEAVCGRVPSQSLLCNYYCKVTHRRTPRMDALHQRLISPSKFFCVDASYKVPKWLASISGEQMYSTLITMVDEDHIPLASYFAVSDNHEELESALLNLQTLGWSPICGFTDNVPRDQDFLVENVKSLCNGKTASPAILDDHENDGPTNILQLRSPPQYCISSESAMTALNLFEEKLQQMDEKVVSFDMEWSMYFDGTPAGQTAIVGFGSLCLDKVLVIHLAKIRNKNELLNHVARLFRNQEYLFVGFNIASDLTKLRKDFPGVDFGRPRMRDLGWWCIYRGLLEHKKGGHTLDTASAVILKKTVPKEAHLRQSDVWSRPGPLSDEARTYLARDVEGGILIFQHTKDLPDLSLRLKRSELKVGMEVDIMPTRKTVVTPIARGVICQIGAKNTRTMTGIPLTENRVVIEVEQVLKPNCGLYYTQVGRRKCKCGANDHKHGISTEKCDIRTFGDAQNQLQDPFTIVEDVNRLRLRHNDQQPTQEVQEVCQGESQSPVVQHRMTMPQTSLIINDRDEEPGSQLAGVLAVAEEGQEQGDELLNIDLPQQAILTLDHLLEYKLDNDDDVTECLPSLSHGGHEMEVENNEEEYADRGLEHDVFIGANARQLAIAYETQGMVRRIIKDAHELAQHGSQNEEALDQHHRSVLGDAFHFMDRVKVPVHHDWKAAYFSALRDAIFIFDVDDKKKVQSVLLSKGKTWEQEVSFHSRYICRRVRRYIPPGEILHGRVKAVFDFFGDKQDGKTGKRLFGGKDAMKKKDLVLEALRRGELSDPPIPLYVPEFLPGTNMPKKDRDGLPLWRCLRGTGPAENAHSQYTRAFGQVRAGPMYSCAVLRNHHHRKTMRAAMAHRPGFPQIYHFDPELVDSVEQLNINVFGRTKYSNWPAFHEAVPSKRSPFGIIPLVEDCGRGGQRMPCEFLSPQLRFLASSMDSDLPYTPVATREEKRLFKKLLEGTVNEAKPLNANTFFDLTTKWNRDHVKVPTSWGETTTIFPKYSRHLTNAYKQWRINTSKADRLKEAQESQLLSALKLNPGIQVPGIRQPDHLGEILPQQPLAKRQRKQPGIHIPQLLPTPPQPHPPPSEQPILQQQPTHPQQPTLQQQPTHQQASTFLNVPINTAAAPSWWYYAPPQQPLHRSPPGPLLLQSKQRAKMKCTICNKLYCRRPWNKSGKCNGE
jgi:hypothetical protein